MKKLLNPTEVAHLLDVSEKTVARMAGDGRLPKPLLIGGKPRYPQATIYKLLGVADVDPNDGLTVETKTGSTYIRIVKAKYEVIDLRLTYAVFELEDGSLHLRPWLSYIVDDLPDHEPVFLACEDTDTPEVRFADLPPLASAVWTLPWGGASQ